MISIRTYGDLVAIAFFIGIGVGIWIFLFGLGMQDTTISLGWCTPPEYTLIAGLAEIGISIALLWLIFKGIDFVNKYNKYLKDKKLPEVKE